MNVSSVFKLSMLYRLLFISLFCFSVIGVVSAQTCTGSQPLTSAKCTGDDISQDEAALVALVNDYRVANKLKPLKLSRALSLVANRRVLDLNQNIKQLTHSWSNCPYEISDQKTWPCVLDAPARFRSGYSGQGYETLYHTTTARVDPPTALAAWKKSKLHNSIILNLDQFALLPWDEVGVGIDGQYASLWFGYPHSSVMRVSTGPLSLERLEKGLDGFVLFSAPTGSSPSRKWTGQSPDKTLVVEIIGDPEDLRQANISLHAAVAKDGKMDERCRSAIIGLMRELFPDWHDSDGWIGQNASIIAHDRSATAIKLVLKTAIEIRRESVERILVTIRPQAGGIQSF